MPNVLAADAEDRVRAYIGDDHAATQGAVPPSVVLIFLQAEYDAVWARLARGGCVPPIDTAVASTITVGGGVSESGVTFGSGEVIAVVEVYELMDDGTHRGLEPAQPSDGPLPFDAVTSGAATEYAIYGAATGSKIQLYPFPTGGGAYRIKYIPATKTLIYTGTPTSTQSLSIEGLPACGVDRVILGTVQRCMLRVNTTSPGVRDLIRAADEDVQFHIAGRLHGNPPRIRNVDHRTRGWPRRGQDLGPSWRDPNGWIWLS